MNQRPPLLTMLVLLVVAAEVVIAAPNAAAAERADSEIILSPHVQFRSKVHNFTQYEDRWLELHTTDKNYDRSVWFPITIPSVVAGVPQKIKRISIEYKTTAVSKQPTKILATEVRTMAGKGQIEKLYADRTERASDTWTTFDVNIAQPTAIKGLSYLHLKVRYGTPNDWDKPGDMLCIGTIKVTYGE